MRKPDAIDAVISGAAICTTIGIYGTVTKRVMLAAVAITLGISLCGLGAFAIWRKTR